MRERDEKQDGCISFGDWHGSCKCLLALRLTLDWRSQHVRACPKRTRLHGAKVVQARENVRGERGFDQEGDVQSS